MLVTAVLHGVRVRQRGQRGGVGPLAEHVSSLMKNDVHNNMSIDVAIFIQQLCFQGHRFL